MIAAIIPTYLLTLKLGKRVFYRHQPAERPPAQHTTSTSHGASTTTSALTEPKSRRDADDRHPTRHHGRDLADSLERVLRLGGAVIAEQDATPRHCCLPRARRRMHVGCHRRRYEVAAARGRAGAAPASAAPCWISRTRNASTMSLTPRISAKAATQATSRMALRP